MNLNYGYDKDTLLALIATADATFDEHNLVIDFDGEVILDPEVRFRNVPLESYKFHTKIKDKSLHSPVMVSALYDALEMIFQKLIREEESDFRINASDGSLAIAA